MAYSWMKFILLISFVYISYGASLLETGGIVPVNKLGTKSYYFSYNFKANFIQANQFCIDLGMRLVTIPSVEVNNFVYGVINVANKDTRYWTSGTNLINGKDWVWLSSAKPVVYTNWLPNQPDLPAERCIEIQLQKNSGLKWNNLDCNVQLSFVCESPDLNDKGQVVQSNWLGAFADPAISPNFPVFNYNKNSYYIGNLLPLSYMDAGKFCNNIGMELVSIDSKEENDYIYNYIRNTLSGTTFWSGGSRLIDGINFLWLPSGRKVGYTNWLKGQPDSKVDHCIQLVFQKDVGLFWNDLNCAVAQNFICKTPTANIATCPVIDPSCEKPIGKVPVVITQGVIPAVSNYYYIGKEKVSATNAVKKCEAMGLKLVSIKNKDQQNAVNKAITESGVVDWFWTSGTRVADKKTWLWLLNEPITEFFWNMGEPNNAQGNEECISIIKKVDASVWNDAPCANEYFYICESPLPNNNCQNCCNQPPLINVFIDNKPQQV